MIRFLVKNHQMKVNKYFNLKKKYQIDNATINNNVTTYLLPVNYCYLHNMQLFIKITIF